MTSFIKAFAIDIDGTLTENGGGIIHLPAVQNLRTLEKLGYRIIYVTGRSSVEAYILSVFTGTTKIAVGENGGVVTLSPSEHIILGNKEECIKGYRILTRKLENVKLKNVFDRMTEVVLERTFNIELGKQILQEDNLGVELHDSQYSFHINNRGINKATGLAKALDILKIKPSETVTIGDSETDIPLFQFCAFGIALNHADDIVKSKANYVVSQNSGKGLVEALDYIALNFFGKNAIK
ncbi:MAG TPA: phosphoglycolate phosphatase [Nitrososphaeraceae archaeon]|jgi:phosphoglycolate phosphatase (TIGR01487 family)|nr:phosphoglycolate phosphatase [Nitrososphaeraceae archaeon]